jgi:hypothetical protein
LSNSGEWVEIKGYLDDKSKIKLKRFKRYYPKEFAKMTCVISKYSKDARAFMEELEVPTILFYEEIKAKYSNSILYWEGK